MLQFPDHQDKKAQEMMEITILEKSATENVVDETAESFLRVKGKLLEVFILNVSNIPLILVVKHEAGISCSFWVLF